MWFEFTVHYIQALFYMIYWENLLHFLLGMENEIDINIFKIFNRYF